MHAPRIEYDQNYGVTLVPLWAYTLAAHIPESWAAEVVNTQIDPTLGSVNASDIFAFSGLNKDLGTVRAAYDVIKSRFPDAIYVVGGPMTWSMEQEGKIDLLNYFNHIFIMDGEETLPRLLMALDNGDIDSFPSVIHADRFPISKSKPIRLDLLEKNIDKYFGGMIEVSRGCPFLCEFCDVRVLPGNNRSNNKAPEVIVQELDAYYRLGISQFQFVCDNFIGDIQWARECVDAILEWQERTRARISIFTWLTINLYKMPDLMRSMRKDGFSLCNIGIESVNHNSLLETAKVQNERVELLTATSTIHAYGFIIVPGFIFGFDSDTEGVFDDTLRFMIDAGTIGSEPAFLQALAGTPLYQRMEQSGRLIDSSKESVVVRKGNVGVERQIETNIQYLLDSDFLADGFVKFMKTYLNPTFQYARFVKHMSLIDESGVYVEPPDSGGYASIGEYLKFQMDEVENRKMLAKRVWWMLCRPGVMWSIFKAWKLTRRLSKKYFGLGVHFHYWAYVWSNMGMKYSNLKREHINLHSVGKNFDFGRFALSISKKSSGEAKRRGDEKSEQQARYTNQALEKLLAERPNVAAE